MAQKNKYFSSTCIDFNLNDETELICNNIFNAFGRYKKLQLQFLLTSHFPEYYQTGHIDGELRELVNRFQRDFYPNPAKNPIFFGWCYHDSGADRLSDDLLNRMLCGGAKDFIVYLLTTTYGYMFPSVSSATVHKETLNPPATQKHSKKAPTDDLSDSNTDQFLKTLSHQFDHMNNRGNNYT